VTAGTGFFDLQINGYGGVDFNTDGLTELQLNQVCQRLEQDEVGGILATIITADLDAMCRRLTTLRQLRDRDPLAKRIIAGFHIEGPFLNEAPGFRGAHPADFVRPATEALMKRLLEAAGGLCRVVTLAPERDPGLEVTRMLARSGVVVSAGHTDASLDKLKAAIDAGLSMFTHVGNGCAMTIHRHDNIIQRVLSLSDHLWLTFVADGVHVPWPALRNYLRAAAPERSIVASDAMSAAGLGPGRYTLGHWDVLVGPDMVARAPDGSHLIGSAGTMRQSHQNLIDHLGIAKADADRLTMHNPRAAAGL
jgi:N-acetylglucosamine-6-phosphate deacetylase